MTELVNLEPSSHVSARELFGIDSDMKVPVFGTRDEHVPFIDDAYRFDTDVTLAILSGFVHNRRVLYRAITARVSPHT